MKGGTEYARKIKRLFKQLKRKYGTPPPCESTDPVLQGMFGILHQGTTVARAERALARLQSAMVDLNELRVSTPSELVEIMGSTFPNATEKARAVIKFLNQVFDHTNGLDLSSLKSQSKRDARQVLLAMDGIDPAAAAGVMLFSLEGHAVPVDDVTLAVLRKQGLIDQNADVEEVQAFLERNVSAAQAIVFAKLLRRYGEDQAKRLGPLLSQKPKEKAETKAKSGKKRSPATRKKPAKARSKTTKKRSARPKKAAKKKTKPRKPATRKARPVKTSRSSSRAKKRKTTAKKVRTRKKVARRR